MTAITLGRLRKIPASNKTGTGHLELKGLVIFGICIVYTVILLAVAAMIEAVLVSVRYVLLGVYYGTAGNVYPPCEAVDMSQQKLGNKSSRQDKSNPLDVTNNHGQVQVSRVSLDSNNNTLQHHDKPSTVHHKTPTKDVSPLQPKSPPQTLSPTSSPPSTGANAKVAKIEDNVTHRRTTRTT